MISTSYTSRFLSFFSLFKSTMVNVKCENIAKEIIIIIIIIIGNIERVFEENLSERFLNQS